MLTQLYHLHALSPLHVGVGQAIGIVDLPIMREKTTQLPLVPGSAIKGVLRDQFRNHPRQTALFGPDEIKAGDAPHAGALAFADAQLLLLPVRSLIGVCAYATSPYLLQRYQRLTRHCGVSALPEVPSIGATQTLTTSDCGLQLDGKVLLEDLDLDAQQAPAVDAWAQHLSTALRDDTLPAELRRSLLIVPDAVLDHLAHTGTDIRARIRLNDQTGTVAQGALWYEENLPAEAVLAGLLAIDQARDPEGGNAPAMREQFTTHLGPDSLVQIGGKASVGRGLVRFIL